MSVKKFVSSILVASAAMGVLGANVSAATGDVKINKTNFPDAVFRKYVSENFDKNKDKKLSKSEIKNAKKITIIGGGLTDMTGLKYFTELKYLDVTDNSLTKLSVKSNKKLSTLICSMNNIKKLDISNCPRLIMAYMGEFSVDDKCYRYERTDTPSSLLIVPHDPDPIIYTNKATIKGWYQIGDNKVYYRDGEMLWGGSWRKIDKKYYMFDMSGLLLKKTFLTVGQKGYYLSKSGARVTGWKELKSANDGKKHWYYFNSKGVSQIGWTKIDKKKYYFEQEINDEGYEEYYGVRVTGFYDIDGKDYYFNKSGAMVTGWKKISKKWYYFKKSGVMAKNEKIKIGKKTYKFNSKGVCTNH